MSGIFLQDTFNNFQDYKSNKIKKLNSQATFEFFYYATLYYREKNFRHSSRRRQDNKKTPPTGRAFILQILPKFDTIFQDQPACSNVHSYRLANFFERLHQRHLR